MRLMETIRHLLRLPLRTTVESIDDRSLTIRRDLADVNTRIDVLRRLMDSMKEKRYYRTDGSNGRDHSV